MRDLENPESLDLNMSPVLLLGCGVVVVVVVVVCFLFFLGGGVVCLFHLSLEGNSGHLI